MAPDREPSSLGKWFATVALLSLVVVLVGREIRSLSNDSISLGERLHLAEPAHSVLELSVKDQAGKGASFAIDTAQGNDSALSFVHQLLATMIVDSKVIARSEIDEANAGLAAPALTLEFRIKTGDVKLAFGEKNELLDVRYLWREGDNKIYLVSEQLYELARGLTTSTSSIPSSSPSTTGAVEMLE